jgi:hexosaminidase
VWRDILYEWPFIAGGDEVDTACWGSTPAISKWLSDRKMSPDDGYAFFVKKVAGFAISQGHRPVQ